MNDAVWELLLVEDDEDDYILLNRRLEETRPGGFNLTWANSLDAAVQQLDHRPFDAALIDYNLGEATGLAVVDEIVRRGHTFPLLMLTGRGDLVVDLQGMRSGVSEYLVKNEITSRSLERAVRYAIERAKNLAALRQANEMLSIAHAELEQRVRARTDELRLQNLKLQTILDNAPLTLWAIDSEMRLMLTEGRELAGVEPNPRAMVGQSVEALTRARPDVAALLKRALAGEEFHTVIRSEQQPEKYYEVHFAPQHGPDGKVTAVVGLQLDVSERIAAEGHARDDARRREFLAKLSQDLAAAGRDRVSVNDVVTRLVVELLGDSCSITLLSDDGKWLQNLATRHSISEAQARLERIFAGNPYPVGEGITGQVAQSGKPLRLAEIDQEALRRSVRPEYAEYLADYPLYSLMVAPMLVRGRVVGTIGANRQTPDRPYTAEDENFLMEIGERAGLAIENAGLFAQAQAELAERRRAEAELEVSRALFRQLFEAAPDPIVLLDARRNLLQANRQAIQTFGLDSDTTVGLPFSSLIAQQDRGEVERRLAEQPAPGEALRLERDIVGLRPDGVEVPIEPVWSHFNLGEETGVLCILHDITRRKALEAELSEVQRRLMGEVEAERRRLAKELHDGPIQEMYGVSFALRSISGELDAANFQTIMRLESAQKQIYETIQTMRDISRLLHPPTLSPFGLEKTIRSHIDHFNEQYPDIHVALDLEPDSGELSEAVRLVLYRIFQNALSNIARHANAGQAVVRLKLDDDTVVLEVQDNGRGFDFHGRYVDFVRGGHMGLAGSNERAEAIGGKLEVITTPGAGTLLRVTAPINMPAGDD